MLTGAAVVDTTRGAWRARPGWARLIRVVAWVVPVVISVGAALLVEPVAAPRFRAAAVSWWAFSR